MKYSLWITLAIVLWSVPSFAQWTQPVGGYYAKTSGSFFAGNLGFGLSGDTFATDDFSSISFGLYGEYGIADGNTLTINANLGGVAKYGDNSTFVFGPVMFGNRVQILQRRGFSWSTEFRAGFDTSVGDEDLAAGEEAFVYRASRGSGSRLELVSQQGFAAGPFFAGSEFGLRFNWYAPETDFDLMGQVSVGLSGPLNLVPMVFGTFNWSLERPQIANVAGTGKTRYVGVGFGLGWWPFEHVGFTATASGAPYAISNAGAAVFNVGVQFK